MKDAIIRAEALRFSYTSAEGVAPVVLDGVDLSIQEGTFVAVLGHNGSGKSTLAKHMNAILLPSGGKVYVDGIDTVDEAAQADRLVVMTKGRVIADGPPRQVFQDVEGLRSVGLTVPDTTQLLWELRQEGLDGPLDALSDEECAQALCQLLNAASKKGSQP